MRSTADNKLGGGNCGPHQRQQQHYHQHSHQTSSSFERARILFASTVAVLGLLTVAFILSSTQQQQLQSSTFVNRLMQPSLFFALGDARRSPLRRLDNSNKFGIGSQEGDDRPSFDGIEDVSPQNTKDRFQQQEKVSYLSFFSDGLQEGGQLQTAVVDYYGDTVNDIASRHRNIPKDVIYNYNSKNNHRRRFLGKERPPWIEDPNAEGDFLVEDQDVFGGYSSYGGYFSTSYNNVGEDDDLGLAVYRKVSKRQADVFRQH